MNSEKENRSVIRTQRLLKNGLTQLMKEKPIQKISVKELTDLVNLNRGTFYLHYKDIYDLMEQLENDMLDEFVSITDSHTATDMNGHPFPLLLDLFTFLKKNQEFTHILLIENREQHFGDKLKDLLRKRCLNDWTLIFAKASEESCELYSSFILSGCIGIIENWICTGATQSPEVIAEYTEKIMLRGLDTLK